jgi:hypothetical protein
MSTQQQCPIRTVSLSILALSITQASLAHPKYAESLQGQIAAEDKNCNTHGCAMWDKRRKRCGLIQGGMR